MTEQTENQPQVEQKGENAETYTDAQIDEIFEQFKNVIKIGNIDQAKQLIQQYQSLDLPNKLDTQTGQTVLYLLSDIIDESQAIQMLELLIQHKVDVNFRDNYKQGFMYYVIREGRVQLYRKMIENGAQINEPDVNGQTPVFFAARDNRFEIVQEMIKDKVNLMVIDSLNDQTPLYYAAKYGNTDMCRLLVENGCNPNHLDSSQKTAYFFAKKANKKQTTEYLNTVTDKELKTIKKETKKPNPKRAADATKVEHKLVFYDDENNPQDLTDEQLESFQKDHPEVYQMLTDPDQFITQEMLKEYEEVETWQNIAQKTLKDLNKQKGAYLFVQPVDPAKYGIDDYYDVISEPMDFSTIKTKLQYNAYSNFDSYVKDMHLIFNNCILYNQPDTEIGSIGVQMKRFLETKLNEYNYEKFLSDKEGTLKYLEEKVQEQQQKLAQIQSSIEEEQQEPEKAAEEPAEAAPVAEDQNQPQKEENKIQEEN